MMVLPPLYSYVCIWLLLATKVLSSTPLVAASSIQPAKCSKVFIISPSKTGSAHISKALAILGYTDVTLFENGNQSSSATNYEHGFDVFTTLSAGPIDIVSQHKDAKFILSIEKDDDSQYLSRSWRELAGLFRRGPALELSQQVPEHYSNYLTSVKETFADAKSGDRLMSIMMGEAELSAGDQWLSLCRFLGLGYSIVERMRLKEFPTAGL